MPPASPPRAPAPQSLPTWAGELIAQYESGAASQFICHGNVHDRMVLNPSGNAELGDLTDFVVRVLMPRFDVVLGYDLGNGLRVERGGEVFAKWPRIGNEPPQLPREPRAAIELLTQYFRYCVNLRRLGKPAPQVGCLIHSIDLVVPAAMQSSYELSALASLIRDWAGDADYADLHLATFLIADNLADLHPLITNNPRAALAKIPLPSAEELARALATLLPRHPIALGAIPDLMQPAAMLAGATLSSIESLLKRREHLGQPLGDADLMTVKKQLVEKDCAGLIEFIESKRSLDDLHGQEKLKTWLRQDIALWKAGDLQALPMGYLLCGPVGTGKTFLVECLAGEAGVPVVKLKNFRDKWVGSTEGNLEKIFRLIQALGRCFVFIDEADQALGKRDSGGNDGGIGGRIYGMMAQEMSNTLNRGRVIWVLASSRPDLIEVDLKRPGRIDVKIPLFPTTTPHESFALIRALAKRRGLLLADGDFAALEPLMPLLVTPGAAEAIAVKAYRLSRTAGLGAAAALAQCLTGYQSPVAPAVMDFQIKLALDEASDLDFVPEALRGRIARS